MSFFEYNQKENKLAIRMTKGSIFSDKTKLVRSNKEKDEYFKNQGIKKDPTFELHHIVAVYLANDIDEFNLIDNWLNMIYIDANSHKKITFNKSQNSKLNFIDNDVSLKDFSNNEIICKFDEQVKYKISLKDKMKNYNNQLLGK